LFELKVKYQVKYLKFKVKFIHLISLFVVGPGLINLFRVISHLGKSLDSIPIFCFY